MHNPVAWAMYDLVGSRERPTSIEMIVGEIPISHDTAERIAVHMMRFGVAEFKAGHLTLNEDVDTRAETMVDVFGDRPPATKAPPMSPSSIWAYADGHRSE